MLNPLYYFYKLRKPERILLENNISFYRNLSKIDKQKFEYRILRFIKHHRFVGREGVIITPIVKIIISSIAIMLTFKMRDYLFKQLKNIIIYPKDFLSLTTKQFHRGETNPRLKTVVFSWKGFVEGIKIEDDNLNLGIHEFTHALYFSFLTKKGMDSYSFFKTYEKISYYFKNDLQELKNANYLRDYAFVNEVEFFSVITESYFETPKEFERKLPRLYVLLNKIYRIY